jgi:hypothetical protein
MGEEGPEAVAWRSIAEPDEPVVLLRGLRATAPASYERYYARRGRSRAEDAVDLLHTFSAFAFSAVMHLLVLILLVEFVYIAAPIVQETILTAQLFRPAGTPDVPSPEPVAKKGEEPKLEKPAEAPKTANEPVPEKTPAVPVIGKGASSEESRLFPVGVIENVSSIPETDVALFEGTGMFDHRSDGGRRAAVGRFGGNAASEAAVELGLRWLAAHQSRDGNWSPNGYASACPSNDRCGGSRGQAGCEHGVTGLALLAFLGAGYTHLKGPYQATVERGLQWLVKRQDPKGFFYDSSQGAAIGGMYGHGVCTFALGEAAAMTDDRSLLPALEKAVGAIQASQQYNGGWWYHPSPAEKHSEFTLSVWQMMGLKAAAVAGVPVPPAVIDKAKQHVRDSTDPNGGVYYSARGNITMGATGAGLFARCMFGMAQGGALERGLAYADKDPGMEPDLQRQTLQWEYVYYWYYRTLVAFQMQGKPWRDWNRKMRPYLVTKQQTRGHAAGSWPMIDYTAGGTVYSTSICVLMLETYYRYLPMTGDRGAILESLASASLEPEGEVLTKEEERRLDLIVPPKQEILEERHRRDLAEARQKLLSEKPEERYIAARKLAEFADKAAVREMMGAAEQAQGRLKAAHLLFVGRLKCEESIPYLMKQFDSADELVRAAAVSALMNVTGVYIAEAERWREWHADYLKKKAGKK